MTPFEFASSIPDLGTGLEDTLAHKELLPIRRCKLRLGAPAVDYLRLSSTLVIGR